MIEHSKKFQPEERLNKTNNPFKSDLMNLDRWEKLDLINKFHEIKTINDFTEKNIPIGWEMYPSMGSFHYRPDGQFDKDIDQEIFPRVKSELSFKGQIAFGIPADKEAKDDGVYYLLRKIPS